MADTSTVVDAVHLRDVSKSYGDLLVLDNLDFSLPPGEFCSLVGPSGCGKSTLFRLILGQEFPNKGMLLINGEEGGFPDDRRGIVFQHYSLFPHLTVLENVMMGRLAKISPIRRWFDRSWYKEQFDRFEAEAVEFLRRVRMADSLGKYPHELSGGMRQRVAIAQALLPRPKILMMDEPFGALDRGTRRDAQMFLIELWEELNEEASSNPELDPMTVFFVTHDLEEAVFMGSRLAVLSQHYTDDRGADFQRGAKFVIDQSLKDSLPARHTMSFERYVHRHTDLIETIDREGMDPAVLQHMSDFRLDDPSSWRTHTAKEIKET